MKRARKGMLRSFVAVLVSFSLAFSMAIPAFATPSSEDETIVYVSIGDSMTNGYGLEGYSGESGVVNYANDSYANRFAAWLAGYDGEIEDDQVVFTGTNGTVDHRQLAMSGMRAEDLHWLLELDHANEELIQSVVAIPQGGYTQDAWYGLGFETGDFRTHDDFADNAYRLADGAAKILAIYDNGGELDSYFDSSYATADLVSKAQSVLSDPYYPEGAAQAAEFGGHKFLQIGAEFYQESVKEADIISLALGNTNFGTYMLTEIMEVVMYNNTDRFTDRYDIEKVFGG